MRFLLFNVVVLGALFYLFTADKTDIRAATDNAHAVVSRAGTLADQAVDRIDSLMGKAGPEVQAFASEPKMPEALPQVVAPVATPAAPPRPMASAPAVQPVQPAAPEKTVAQDQPSAVPAPPAAPEIKESGQPVNAPTRLVAGEIPEHWVPERSVAKVDPAVTERLLAKSAPTAAGPAATAEPETPAKAVAGGKPEIAIAKGETLMSPRERRKELAALAEDMELLSLKKLTR